MIPKGIKLDIVSWENDADMYRTISKTGLSEETARFFIEFAELFRSGSNNGGKTYGNAYGKKRVNWVQLRIDAMAIFNKHPLAEIYDRQIQEIITENNDTMSDDELEALAYPGENSTINFISDIEMVLLGVGGADDRVFRVFESYTAHYIPTDIPEMTFD